jgi:hypothetical protein
MGEMAEYMLNGDDCQSCGEYLGEGDGFPRNCAACDDGEDDDYAKALAQTKKKPKPPSNKDMDKCRSAAGLAMVALEKALVASFGEKAQISKASKKKQQQKLANCAIDNLRNMGVIK